jgi:hypothetical protein
MEKLEPVIAPMLADLKADGHALGSFVPALPEFLDPDFTSPFVSKAVCAVCHAWIAVRWECDRFRIEGTLFGTDGCNPSLRQPAA